MAVAGRGRQPTGSVASEKTHNQSFATYLPHPNYSHPFMLI